MYYNDFFMLHVICIHEYSKTYVFILRNKKMDELDDIILVFLIRINNRKIPTCGYL